MFKTDLLYTDEEHIYKKQKIIEDSVFDDLKIKQVFEFCGTVSLDNRSNIKEKDLEYTFEILKSPCQLKKDILFRQEIFKQLLKYKNLTNGLYTALSDIDILLRIREDYDFAYGGEEDIEYLKAINYVFFIKSYQVYLNNLVAVIKDVEFEGETGLYNFVRELKAECERCNSDEMTEPVEKMLLFFKDKTNITGELRTQNGVFNLFNFDTDEKNITSTLPEKISFLDLIRNMEDYLDIYKPETEIKPKVDTLSMDTQLYLPDKYTNFEKRFTLQLMYDEETEHNMSFEPMAKKIIEIHDGIDVSCFSVVFEQMKYYRTMCKIISVISNNCINPLCYPVVYEDFVKLNMQNIFDPVSLIQKLSDHKDKYRTNGLPDEKIRDIIPNDISFENKNLYVVTGPNNGGKTAFARAIGISLVFFGAGSPIMAESADLSVGINVMTHFTVNETHLQESGRLQHELERLNEIVEKSDAFSFIILDETFAGTNSVKALDLFDEFLDKVESINFHCIYVTHFHNIAFFIEDIQSKADAQTDKKYAKCDNLIAVIDNDTAGRTYKILPTQPSDTSYSKDIVKKHRLTWEQLRELL